MEGLCIELLFCTVLSLSFLTGCAVLCVSLRYDMCLREPLLLNCCFLLCRGGVRPMDVVSVTTSPPPSINSRAASPRRLFSFLSVAWGFVSDVDIESERWVCYCLDCTNIHHWLCSSKRYPLFLQVPWPGLCSLHPGHPGAHSFSSILQGSSVLPASVCQRHITR